MEGTKIFLDIAKESSDCFPFLKSALGFVNALIMSGVCLNSLLTMS